MVNNEEKGAKVIQGKKIGEKRLIKPGDRLRL